MSGLTPSLLAVTRRRAPGAIHFVRKVSTSEQSREREIDIIRRLRKQERIIKVTLEADINDFLQRLGLLYKPKSALDEAVQTALRQNKYISTERQMHAETMSGLGTEISDHFDEFKKHLKDFEEEPYPEWQPGDSDIFLRRLDNPRHKHEHLEADMNTKAKDVGRLLDKADKHHESLLKVRDVMREKGVKAAEALADKIVDSHSFDSAPIDAPLDPVDLDAIDEDTPTIRNSPLKEIQSDLSVMQHTSSTLINPIASGCTVLPRITVEEFKVIRRCVRSPKDGSTQSLIVLDSHGDSR
ncbi:hypothetical protein AUEXF2481DRAFT_3363 [Aureobasidium subglaciale EXF-2481]|uniref:Uncharacterized protein n=1 Tax=Aureobasidium subglaciale (strain EXF-2481) TaxID=1043005 RepID=A0A074YIC7_AURSE|nr:uncharacterized protein AUEXF2481DRAFT_3363 [Aureobasidium subglaciale EXF-2481]KEQ97563.1 hypothetical protein AUEXF2481DRAFT_3363 [Aureobasidium subglaciale EXF-2481]